MEIIDNIKNIDNKIDNVDEDFDIHDCRRFGRVVKIW